MGHGARCWPVKRARLDRAKQLMGLAGPNPDLFAGFDWEGFPVRDIDRRERRKEVQRRCGPAQFDKSSDVYVMKGLRARAKIVRM